MEDIKISFNKSQKDSNNILNSARMPADLDPKVWNAWTEWDKNLYKYRLYLEKMNKTTVKCMCYICYEFFWFDDICVVNNPCKLRKYMKNQIDHIFNITNDSMNLQTDLMYIGFYLEKSKLMQRYFNGFMNSLETLSG